LCHYPAPPAQRLDLAGAMIWDLPGDDVAGSLIHALAAGLGQAARQRSAPAADPASRRSRVQRRPDRAIRAALRVCGPHPLGV